MMQNDKSHGSCASVARGFAALGAVWVGLLASPAEAAPLAYANYNANTVPVIDTASNTVVATIPVGNSPSGVAVAPDGKHAYVANYFGNSVSVIDTATNMVVGTAIPVGTFPERGSP
jgi:YVTN family beta-propeller protein